MKSIRLVSSGLYVLIDLHYVNITQEIYGMTLLSFLHDKNVLVPRPQVPPLDDFDRKELEELKESKQEEFNSGDVLDAKHGSEDAPVSSDDEEEMDYQDSSDDDFKDDFNDDNEDEEDDENVESNIPDLPEHVRNRCNPPRGARDSSLKALEKFQAHSVSKTLELGVSDPKTRKQALESSHREKWLEAEREELRSLYEMKVWE